MADPRWRVSGRPFKSPPAAASQPLVRVFRAAGQGGLTDEEATMLTGLPIVGPLRPERALGDVQFACYGCDRPLRPAEVAHLAYTDGDPGPDIKIAGELRSGCGTVAFCDPCVAAYKHPTLTGHWAFAWRVVEQAWEQREPDDIFVIFAVTALAAPHLSPAEFAALGNTPLPQLQQVYRGTDIEDLFAEAGLPPGRRLIRRALSAVVRIAEQDR